MIVEELGVRRSVEFHHEGKVYYGNKDGVWFYDRKYTKPIEAEEAARIETACKIKYEEKQVRGRKIAEAITAAITCNLHPYIDYLDEVEKAELAADRRDGFGDGKPYPAGDIEPNDAYHETGANTPG